MNGVTLHAVTDNDADFLFSIMNIDSVLEALNENPTQLFDWTEAVRAWSEDDDEEDYIIRDGETQLGWIGINGLSSADRVAYLKAVVVLPDYQNKGIGQYAVAHVLDMLRQRKYTKAALYTDQSNHKAQACYHKCGFRIVETFEEEMANGKTVARCRMERVL